MASKLQLNDILTASEIFEALGDVARTAVIEELRPMSYAAGQSIFSRGDEGCDLFIVLDGRVRLSVLTADGREFSFSHAGPGAIFGEIAMLDNKRRTADATAVCRTEAMLLSRAALQRLIASEPTVAQAIITFLCHRLRQADMQLEGVALHRVEVRLARYLAGAAAQVPAAGEDDGDVELDLGMSQGELALLLGASRPKVNGALMALEEQGVIRRAGSKLKCNLEDLRAVAELE